MEREQADSPRGGGELGERLNEKENESSAVTTGAVEWRHCRGVNGDGKNEIINTSSAIVFIKHGAIISFKLPSWTVLCVLGICPPHTLFDAPWCLGQGTQAQMPRRDRLRSTPGLQDPAPRAAALRPLREAGRAAWRPILQTR